MPATLEAKDYVTGVPAKAEPARPAGPAGWRVRRRGAAASASGRELDIAAVVNCCHGGPGEDGSLQAALDLAGVRYTGPGAAGAALGMDKLAFGGAMAAAGLPSLPRTVVHRRRPRSRLRRALHREAAVRRLVDRHRDHRRPRHGTGAGRHVARTSATARSSSRTWPASVDLNVSVRSWPKLQRVGGREAGAQGRLRPHLHLRREVPRRRRGPVVGARGSCRPYSPARWPSASARWPSRWRPVALVRGAPRIDFLWHGDDIWVNEINTIPGRAGLVLLDRRGGLVRGAARRPARGGRQGTRALPARPRAPTAPPCERPARSPASSR